MSSKNVKTNPSHHPLPDPRLINGVFQLNHLFLCQNFKLSIHSLLQEIFQK